MVLRTDATPRRGIVDEAVLALALITGAARRAIVQGAGAAAADLVCTRPIVIVHAGLRGEPSRTTLHIGSGAGPAGESKVIEAELFVTRHALRHRRVAGGVPKGRALLVLGAGVLGLRRASGINGWPASPRQIDPIEIKSGQIGSD